MDGPAIVYSNYVEIWYKNGLRHRIGGPAFYSNGIEIWYQNGLRHREDGPAVTDLNGKHIWYINDICQSEHNKQTLSKTVICDECSI